MTKIRNINVAGRRGCPFTYAGPVGKGRSSRRKLMTSFSGAAPPQITNLLKAIVTIMAFPSVTESEKPQNKNSPFFSFLFAALLAFCLLFTSCEPTPIPTEKHKHGDNGWSSWVVTTPETCTTTGVETSECIDCEDVPPNSKTQIRQIDPNAHSWSGEYVSVQDPTCSSAGIEAEYCEHNNEHLKPGSERPYGNPDPSKHVYSWWTDANPATCTEDGLAVSNCDECGHEASQVLNALGHQWGGYVTTKLATCTTTGTETRTCLRDPSHTETRDTAINMNNHDYQWVSHTDATCTSAATERQVCQNNASHIGSTQTVGSALGHAASGIWVEKPNDSTKEVQYCTRSCCPANTIAAERENQRVMNIEGFDIPDEWKGFPPYTTDVNSAVKFKKNLLLSQSGQVQGKFAEWRNTLTPGTPLHTFAQNVQVVHGMMDETLQNAANVTAVKNAISFGGGGKIATLLPIDSAAQETFNKQWQAFHFATMLKQRAHGNTASLQSDFAALCTELGISHNPSSPNYDAAIQTLTTSMTSTMTGAGIEPADALIQQWEDFAQFNGWTDDLQAYGYGLTNIASNKLNHPTIQNNWGLELADRVRTTEVAKGA